MGYGQVVETQCYKSDGCTHLSSNPVVETINHQPTANSGVHPSEIGKSVLRDNSKSASGDATGLKAKKCDASLFMQNRSCAHVEIFPVTVQQKQAHFIESASCFPTSTNKRKTCSLLHFAKRNGTAGFLWANHEITIGNSYALFIGQVQENMTSPWGKLFQPTLIGL